MKPFPIPKAPSCGSLPAVLVPIALFVMLILGTYAQAAPYHTADCAPADWCIELPELLEIIQFYNVGEFHTATGLSASGFAAGPGSHDGPPHNSDYAPQDWQIQLSELLRLAQLFNSRAYTWGEDTEDDFKPGPGGLQGDWEAVSGVPPWAPRSTYAACAFKDALWLLGGEDSVALPFVRYNDVWRSEDGVSWSEVTASAPWPARDHHEVVVHDGKLWLMGGEIPASRDYYNDVWYSDDGVTWHLATDAAPWKGRAGHGVLSFAGKIWVMGGRCFPFFLSADPYLNDVWSSEDGIHWTEASPQGMPHTRAYHAAAVFADRMWIFGGIGSENYTVDGYTNWQSVKRGDIWCSTDGIAWTEISDLAPWGYRTQASAVAANGALWIISGGNLQGYPEAKSSSLYDDIWSSVDGMHWELALAPTPWAATLLEDALILNQRLWVMGGDAELFLWSTSLLPPAP